jgi:hypothetical protein
VISKNREDEVPLLNPAYRLIIGDRIVDTTDDPRASIVTDLKVELDMDTPADRFTLVMGQVGSWRPRQEDDAAIELGYADDGGLELVLTGTVTTVRPDLIERRVIGHSPAINLLRCFADFTLEGRKAGEIVQDLAGRAGVEVAAAEDAIAFPAYVIDGRRSFWHHLRDLADLCGFDLYVDGRGELVFQRFTGGRTVHLFDYGRHLISFDCRRNPPRATTVQIWGENPAGSEGDDAWAWWPRDFNGSRGLAGRGDPALLGKLMVPGNPAVRLGDAVRVQQIPESKLNGTFQVRSVIHHITKGEGFVTSIGFRGI